MSTVSQLLDKLYGYKPEAVIDYQLLVPTEVWGSFHDCGDGSVIINWFLTEADAEFDQEHLDVGWGEMCIEKIETYEGSKCHLKAVKNSKSQRELK